MKFSASKLKTWMGCPLQAKFKYIDKEPSLQNAKAVFGVCIHEALQEYNNGLPVEACIERFKQTWHEPEILGEQIDTWPKFTTYGGLRSRGIDILKAYDSSLKWENRLVVATEHRFCVPFGEHHLTGVVDLVEKKKSGKGKNSIRIIDYKTSSKQPTLAQLRLDIQFTIYVYASQQPEFWMGFEDDPRYPPIPNGKDLYEAYHKLQRRAIWYHLWTNKEIDAGDRDDGDMMRLYRCLTEVEKAVETGVYVPNISGDTCTFCDFTAQCGVVVPIRHKLDKPIEEEDD